MDCLRRIVWITFSDPDVLRGGYKRPSLAFGEEWRFDLFAYEFERSKLTNQNALPTLLEGRLCPRLDSNQHAVSSATTSR